MCAYNLLNLSANFRKKKEIKKCLFSCFFQLYFYRLFYNRLNIFNIKN